MKPGRKLIGSVQRAIDILNLFEPRAAELGTTEIAKALGLPKSTVAGLVFTLEHNGYLEQNPENRKYRLGYKLAERAGVFLQQFDLRKVAAPVLVRLRDDCQESVNLAVRDGAHVVYIERMHGLNMLGMRSEIGKREKLHSTALGKALLARLSQDELQALLKGYTFTVVTPHTITSRGAFISELEAIRQHGYAIDDQENEIGGRCVAAAITDYHGLASAAISISVPLQRMPDDQIGLFGSKIMAAAREISRKLGAPEDDP